MTSETLGISTLRDELDALGLLELIEDPSLTDVLVNEDGSLHAFGYEGAHVRDEPVPAAKLRSCIATIAGLHRRIVDARSPVLEVSIPLGNVRVTALVPPVTTAPLLALRIPPRRLLSLDDLERFGSLPSRARALLTDAIFARRTVLIAGSVGTGKTALGSALLTHLLDERPTERLVLLEEGARELHVPERRNVSRLLTPPLTMRELLKISLRLNPDRIVVGELRGAEALDWLKAAMSGHPGLATIHATSARGAIARLTDLLEEAGSPASPARVARSVDVIVHLSRARARRWVHQVVRLGEPDAHGDFTVETLFEQPSPPGPLDTPGTRD